MKVLINPSNRMFVLARQARRLPPVWAAILMTFAFVLGAGIIGGIPALILAAVVARLPITDPVLRSAIQQFILLFFSFVPIFFVIWVWVSLYEKRPFWTLGLEKNHAIPRYIRGFLIGIFMFAVVVGVLGVFGYLIGEPNSPPIQGLPALAGILIVGLGWVIQGPGEEVLCRGWLMPVIGVRSRPWMGVVLSAVVFAFYHSLNPNLNLLALLNLTLFGLFIALYVLFDEGLWGAFGLHTAWNWAQGNIFGLPVSGTEPAGGTLVNLGLRGPAWFSGGAFGPEGGAVVTFLLLIAALVTGLLLYNRSRPLSSVSDLQV